MRLSTWTLIVLHLILWTAVGYGVFLYATTNKEISLVKILGSTEKDLALPVYAQFIATQTLSFDRPFIARELVLPLYLPSEPLPIKISLYQNDKLVTWWRYPLEYEEKKEGTHRAHLPFIVPTLVQGRAELRFDGSAISHELQDHAPRLFTESFDDAYAGGNYRIANNEKKGDISLEIIEQKTHYQLFIENIQSNKFGVAIQILRWSSVLLLLACLPSVVVRPFSRKH